MKRPQCGGNRSAHRARISRGYSADAPRDRGEHTAVSPSIFPPQTQQSAKSPLTGRFIRERFTCSVRARSLRKMRVKAASFFSSPRRAPKTRSTIPPTSRTVEEAFRSRTAVRREVRGTAVWRRSRRRWSAALSLVSARRNAASSLATAAEFGLERGRLTQRGDHGHALV